MQYFYMMVGLPGSGKSYYAQKLPDAVIHSSDAIREELLGNISDQSNQELVFQTLHDRVLEDLRTGKNVVYDATNINFRRRQQFLSQVRALRILNLNAVCVFTAAPYSKCLENNATRERTIPESVIKRMYENFDIPMMSEAGTKSGLKMTMSGIGLSGRPPLNVSAPLSMTIPTTSSPLVSIAWQPGLICSTTIPMPILLLSVRLFSMILVKSIPRFSMTPMANPLRLLTTITMSVLVLTIVSPTPEISAPKSVWTLRS